MRQGADDAGRPAADQLEDVGVLLLRHDAAAGADRIGQRQEAELLGAPEDPLLGPAREVLGDQRQDEDRLEHEVAVAGDVQAVGRHAVEAELPGHELAVDRQGRAGQGGGAQGQDVQPLAAVGQPAAVALELLDVGQEVVRRPAPAARAANGCSRAGSASRCRSAAATKARCKADQPRVDPVERIARPELDVGRHLVVAAPRRVQLAADVAQLRRSGPPRCACGCLRARGRTGNRPASISA